MSQWSPMTIAKRARKRAANLRQYTFTARVYTCKFVHSLTR